MMLGDPAVCCWKCVDARRAPAEMYDPAFGFQRMVLCVTCGNKRCPHAADHDLVCTGSNEVGQKGSAYE